MQAMGQLFVFYLVSVIYQFIQAATTGSHSLIMLKQLPRRRSYATHTVKNGIAWVATSGSASTACTGGVNVLMSPMTDFIHSPLMERAVCKLFGVSAIGAMAF